MAIAHVVLAVVISLISCLEAHVVQSSAGVVKVDVGDTTLNVLDYGAKVISTTHQSHLTVILIFRVMESQMIHQAFKKRLIIAEAWEAAQCSSPMAISSCSIVYQ